MRTNTPVGLSSLLSIRIVYRYRTLLTSCPVWPSMSIESDDDPENPGVPTRISLELSEDGEMWLVRDEETGVATEGETRQQALEMLDDAVAAYNGEAGREPTDEELRERGIDPEDNTSGELPDILK